MSRPRRLGALALLLVVGLAAALGVRAVRNGGERGTPAPVESRQLEFRVKASGELASSDSLSVGPPIVMRQWDFTVTSLAPEGKPIAAGQPLVGLDPRQLVEQLDVARARLAESEKELEKVTLEEQERLDGLLLQRADLAMREARARQKLEVPEEIVARLELATQRLDHQLASEELRLVGEQITVQQANLAASVRQAQSRTEAQRRDVAELEKSVSRLTMTAPRAGFVVYTPNWEGKKVAVGDNVWFGMPLVEIADLTRMRVDAVIPEPDAALVKVGQPVEVRLDANPDRLFRGRIESLGRVFRTKSAEKPSTVFDARIAIDKPDPEIMRPGMAAEVIILAAAATARPVVPERAVRAGIAGRAALVVQRAGRTIEVPVTLGRRAPPLIEVLSGLEAGDAVLIPPAEPAP